MAMRTPASPSARSTLMAWSGSCISWLSVISSSMSEGSMPASATMARMRASRSCWRNCRAERFTATGILGAEERLGVVAVGREGGDADARRHHQLLALDFRRSGEPVDDLLRDDRRVVRPLEIRQHHGELIAADARHRVAVAQRRLQALRRLLQELVARGVALRVVD